MHSPSEARTVPGIGDEERLSLPLPGVVANRYPAGPGDEGAVTGSTALARELLVQRCVDAGLDVTGGVSSVTNVLVCNDLGVGTGKLAGARRHSTAIVDERHFLGLLDHVRPGTRKDAPALRRVAPESLPAATPVLRSGPLTGRRVLTLGGPHETATQVRARVAVLGGAAAVNLTAGVTDVVLLTDGTTDTRYAKAWSRNLTVLSWPALTPADWPQTPMSGAPALTPAAASAIHPVRLPDAAPERVVLIRGQVMDLPADPVWSLDISWRDVAGGPTCAVDLVAFIVDEHEKVTTDEDFIFYNQPVSEDGAVQLSENGSREQRVRIDLTALPTWCRRVEVAAAITGDGTFGDVGALVLDVDAGDDVAGGARSVATATLDAATTERTMLVASVYRRGDAWRLRAVGQGYDTGLRELATSFGVEVDEG